MVNSTDAQIKTLAPVLNASFADGVVSTTANVRTMTKYSNGQFYIFAGNGDNSGRSATFNSSCIGNATATVVDESRTIPITNGVWSDNFADGNADPHLPHRRRHHLRAPVRR